MELINKFLKSLEDEGVRYVHWKSNTNVKRALSGEDDLDILVDPKNKEKFHSVLKRLKFIRAFSQKDKWQDGITNFVGLDIQSQKLIHVHLHYKLSLGYDFDKCFTLPIVDSYLSEISNYQKQILLPSYENEYCVLVIRLILKNSLTPFLLTLPHKQLSLVRNAKSFGIIRDSYYDEFVDLKNKIDRKKLKQVLISNFNFLDAKSFSDFENILGQNNNIISFFRAGKKLKRKLKSFRPYGEFTSFRKAFIRVYSSRLFGLLGRLKINVGVDGKKPENGGRIIAFVGGDGAGKTTSISNLKNVLEKQFSVKSIHLGKPNQSILGFSFKLVSKILSILRFKNLSLALLYVSVAINRNLEFQKACKLRDKGFIVLQDRTPLEFITAMDCPRVHTLLNGKYKKLSYFEKLQYRNIKGLDLLFILKLNPKIALKRRPNDNPDELMIRSGQIWNSEYSALYATEIDTGDNSQEEVQQILLEEIWKNFNQPFIRTEVVGLCGTGKTSLHNELKLNIPNIQKCMDVKKYPILVLKSLVINIFNCVLIYMQKRQLFLAVVYLHYKTSIIVLKKWRNDNYFPHKNLIFDQGPIFQLMLLHREKCISSDDLIIGLMELRSLFYNVVLLKAPIDVLYERVSSRTYSKCRVRDSAISDFKKFCESYQKGFDLLEKMDLPIYSIDTGKIEFKETINLFYQAVYEK